jgi:glutamate N-acetyltransferase/amino-acid N-acetyltransferase
MADPSPFAPASLPELPPVAGVRLAVAEAGIRYRGRPDVLLMLFDPGTAVAGVFTRSRCPSAPVDWCKSALRGGKARALLVNSGNANAFTGRKGREAVRISAGYVAKAAKCAANTVFVASTGVIGEPLDPTKFAGVVEDAVWRSRPTPWIEAARAIMTTDTYPKVATRSVRLGGGSATINGIAKGAGMIAPDMATMLAFVATDAPVAQPVLQKLLARGVTDTFNAITVDSDTSTSDTLLLFATGRAQGVRPIRTAVDPRLKAFRIALHDLLLDLAHQVVKDGEGARKFVEVRVKGAATKQAARRIAFSIANSPLVKTAIAGEDANWGRVVMAVGKAGEKADRDRLSIWFGDIRVAHKGERDPAYSEERASTYMRNREIAITVDLGIGKGADRVWTCDLTKDYVAINGDYRS